MKRSPAVDTTAPGGLQIAAAEPRFGRCITDVFPKLRVRQADMPLAPRGEPVWLREQSGPRYQTRLALYQHGGAWLLIVDCEGRGRILIDESEIVVDWDGGTPADHYLRTFALAVWLEISGVTCLHANVLADNRGAIALMAPSHAGKSTLSSAFAGAGWQLLSDDMAALHRVRGEWQVYPSQTGLRLWPDIGEHLYGERYRQMAPVHARFAKRTVPVAAGALPDDQPVPVRRIYLLERDPSGDGTIRCEPVGAAAATVALLANSMLGDAATALGIEAERLSALTTLSSAVPLVRLLYPSGFGLLASVRRAVEEDLGGIGACTIR